MGGYTATQKGRVSRIRGGLSLLPRIFRRHQHLPLGCQPQSPECSQYFQLTTIRSRRTLWDSQPDSLWSDLPPRPTSHSDMLNCAAPAHPRTIPLHGRTLHNHYTVIEFVSPHGALPAQRITLLNNLCSSVLNIYISQLCITPFYQLNPITHPSSARTELQLAASLLSLLDAPPKGRESS